MVAQQRKGYLVNLVLLTVVIQDVFAKPSELVCNLANLQPYDPETQDCTAEGVVNKTTTPAPRPSSTSPTSAGDPDSIFHGKRQTCRDSGDVLECNGNLQCGRHRGYQCCGFGVYHPGSQTCCQLSSSKYKIHQKPDRTHICCGLTVNERGSPGVECQHASNNDKFFWPKKLRNNQEICMAAKYGTCTFFNPYPANPECQAFANSLEPDQTSMFQIDILNQLDGEFLNARVAMWAWPPKRKGRGKKLRMKKKPRRVDVMNIALDRYSPVKIIAGKSFIVFSRHMYLGDAVFYLKANDAVYRRPKRMDMDKKLKKIYRRCGL